MRTTTRQPRHLARGLAALAVSGTLVLAGCSSDSDEADADAGSETSSSASEEPSDDAGDDASEDAGDAAAVTYDLPEGWEDVTEEVAGQAEGQVGGDTGRELASAARATDGTTFADNVNVISLGDLPTDDLGEIEQQTLRELEAGGLQQAETLDRVELDGEEASRTTGVLQQAGVGIRVDQFLTVRDGTAWSVTFSHSTETPGADRRADIDTVTQSLDFED